MAKSKSKKKQKRALPAGAGFGQKQPVVQGESGHSEQYARVLGVISEGPIEGPIGWTDGVYLNETPLSNPDGSTDFNFNTTVYDPTIKRYVSKVFNFAGLTFDFRNGTSDQTVMPGFGDEVTSETSVGTEVQYGVPVVRQINNPNISVIRVRLSFQLQENPPTGGVRKTSIAFRILIREGLTGGFVERYNTTIHSRYSSPVDFEYDFSVNNLGGTVSNFAVRVERLTPQDTNTDRYQRIMVFKAFAEVVYANLNYPFSAIAGLQFDAAQFSSFPQAAFKIGGRLINIPSNATVAADRGLDYSGVWDGTFIQAPIACACPAWIFYDLITNQRYGLGKYVNTSAIDKWALYDLSRYCNEIIQIRGSGVVGDWNQPFYPLAYGTYTIETTGDIDQINPDGSIHHSSTSSSSTIYGAIQYFRITQEPYNATIYTGFIDAAGISKEEATGGIQGTPGISINARASVTAVLLNGNPIYPMTPQYERRYQCHVLLSEKADATSVINNLRSIFRGFAYWKEGTIHLVADRPGNPQMIVTQADIVDGMFTYARTRLRDRHTVARVTWLDPSNFYKPAVELVEDEIGIERYGYRDLELTAFGCTSQSQAHRAGWAALISERLEVETVRFRVRPYGAYAVPGMILKVMDIKRSQVRYGGLTLSATLNSLTFDRGLDLDPGTPYTITLTLPDGSIMERSLSPGYGANTSTVFFAAVAEPPIEGAPWILASPTVQPQLYRVISVVPVSGEDGLLYEISALEYHDEKYDLIDTDYYSPAAPARPSVPPVPPAPTSLSVSLLESASGVLLVANWTKPDSDFVTGYIAEYESIDGDWGNTQQVSFSSASWDVSIGTYSVRVASVDINGRTSNWVQYGPVSMPIYLNANLVFEAPMVAIESLSAALVLDFPMVAITPFEVLGGSLVFDFPLVAEVPV